MERRRTAGRRPDLSCKKFCRTFPWSAIQAVALIVIVLVLILVCILLDVLIPKDWDHDPDYHEKMVQRINRANITWTAVYNKFASQGREHSLGYRPDLDRTQNKKLPVEHVYDENLLNFSLNHLEELRNAKIQIPPSFDAREKWPFCASLHLVPNQGGCGSCWAVAAASVMSDRICIHSKGKQQPRISVEELVSCCDFCMGCRGNLAAINAFMFWRDKGVVTGGDYGSNEGCKPYSISSDCGIPCNIRYYMYGSTPVCERTCHQFYPKSYDDDKLFGVEAYWLNLNPILLESSTSPAPPAAKKYIIKLNIMNHDESMALIQKELVLFGPVDACFMVFEDIQHYESGVYKRFTGQQLYGHCVKLIGWGETEDGVQFWTIVNSWGRNWGENGILRLHRKELPQEIAAGLPKFD